MRSLVLVSAASVFVIIAIACGGGPINSGGGPSPNRSSMPGGPVNTGGAPSPMISSMPGGPINRGGGPPRLPGGPMNPGGTPSGVGGPVNSGGGPGPGQPGGPPATDAGN